MPMWFRKRRVLILAGLLVFARFLGPPAGSLVLLCSVCSRSTGMQSRRVAGCVALGETLCSW